MRQEFVEVIVKHLPPAASELRLLDIGGVVSEPLQIRRHDVQVEIASLYTPHWDYALDSFDAVVAYDTYLSDDLLASVLKVMRAGGRFIVIQPSGSVDEAHVEKLENTGYVRILVEAALAPSSGVLIRGEKIHTTDGHSRTYRACRGG